MQSGTVVRSRFSVFGVLGLALSTTLWAETVVFRAGRAPWPIHVAADARADERLAAEELARVLGLMSGQRWSVTTEPAGQGAGFHIGRTRAAERWLPPLRPAKDLLAPRADEVGPDGFRIRTLGEAVFVEGATPEATPYAVAWLLQRYAGVRWYAPGPLGEVVPRRAEWVLPELALVREPAYVSREITGLYSEEGRAWARRNGLRSRLEFSHNLSRVFPVELLDAHPEWLGLVRGERRRPAGPHDWHWQPNLAREDVAAHAAQVAREVFAREPQRVSFPLGMNDTVRFDQGPETQAVVAPLRYFRGLPDYSPLVFGFMNRVAAAMPFGPEDGRYLGCLAYFWCENVPAFAVDPRVVPYVTTDRTQFYDPGYRAADQALMSRWRRSGVKAYGIWEYGYGAAYVVPRVPQAMLAEAVREGWWRGARGYIADTGPHPGFDAFKIWMLSRLLWEPDRPLAELEADFFNGWYGPAAEPMRRFFARGEAVWMAQPGPPWWIKFYEQADQVLLFPPEVCHELRGLLDEAERATRSAVAGGRSPVGGETEGRTAFGERIALTSRAFAVTEAAATFARQRAGIATGSGGEPRALGGELVALQRTREALAAATDRAFEAGALQRMRTGFLTVDDPVPGRLLALGRAEAQAPAVALAGLAEAGLDVPAHWAALAAACTDGRLASAKNILVDGRFWVARTGGHQPRFLHPLSGDLPANWDVQAMPTERGRVALSAIGPRGRVLRVEGAWDTQLRQFRPAVAGRLYVAEVRMQGRSSPGNDAGLLLMFFDAAGQLVGEVRSAVLPKGENAWRSLVLADVAPAGATKVMVGLSALRQFGGDWLEATDAALLEVGGTAAR